MPRRNYSRAELNAVRTLVSTIAQGFLIGTRDAIIFNYPYISYLRQTNLLWWSMYLVQVSFKILLGSGMVLHFPLEACLGYWKLAMNACSEVFSAITWILSFMVTITYFYEDYGDRGWSILRRTDPLQRFIIAVPVMCAQFLVCFCVKSSGCYFDANVKVVLLMLSLALVVLNMRELSTSQVISSIDWRRFFMVSVLVLLRVGVVVGLCEAVYSFWD